MAASCHAYKNCALRRTARLELNNTIGRAPFRYGLGLTCSGISRDRRTFFERPTGRAIEASLGKWARAKKWGMVRSEEHTSELQSHSDLVCRLLLEKKKKKSKKTSSKNRDKNTMR